MRAAVQALGLAILAFALPASALAEAQQNRLQINKATKGLYDFCLSFEDARVKQDYLAKAIGQGMSVARYIESRPKTRCYRNVIKFIPRKPAPALDGVDYAYVPDPKGNVRCPKGVVGAKTCRVDTTPVRYIEATIIYSSNSFPIFVQLVDQVLVGADGQVLMSANEVAAQ